jgi:hypothetical protein
MPMSEAPAFLVGRHKALSLADTPQQTNNLLLRLDAAWADGSHCGELVLHPELR